MTDWVNLGMIKLLVVKSAGFLEINSHCHLSTVLGPSEFSTFC